MKKKLRKKTIKILKKVSIYPLESGYSSKDEKFAEKILELLKQEKQQMKEIMEKLPKYDLSKNGIDGEFYLKRDAVLEIFEL